MTPPARPPSVKPPRLEPSRRRRVVTRALALSALVLVTFANTLGGGFVFDDHSQIEENVNIGSLANLRRAFTTDFHEFQTGVRGQSSYYRPLVAASYLVDHALWGTRAGPYHVQNIAWHLLAALLFYALILRMVGASLIAGLAAAVWAVHPITSESVAWIAGRTDPIAASGLLGSVLLYLRYVETGRFPWLAGASVLAYVGCLAKEVVIVAPILALLADHCLRRMDPERPRRSIVSLGVLVLPVLVYALQRSAVMGGVAPVDLSPDRLMQRLRVFLSVAPYYVRAWVWPVHLVGDIHATTPRASDPSVIAGAVIALGALAATVVAWRRRSLSTLGLGWMVLTMLPASGVLVPLPIPIAVRYLYLPSLGLVMALAPLLVRWTHAGLLSRPLVAAFVALLAALTVLTLARNREYRDDRTLYQSIVRNAARAGVEPGYNSLLNLGRLYKGEGRLAEAEHYTRRAARAEPGVPLAWNNLGNILRHKGDLPGALAAWEQAVALDSTLVDPLFNVALTLDRLGRIPEATRAYRAALARGLEPASVRRQVEARIDTLESAPRND